MRCRRHVQRNGHRIMRKVNGKWVAALASALLIGLQLPLDEVSATEQESIVGRNAKEDLSSFEGKVKYLQHPVVEREIAKAKEQMMKDWQLRSVEAIRQEMQRQKELKLPAYVIQWGDTLENIALAMKCPEADLLKHNRLKKDSVIATGDILYIDFEFREIEEVSVAVPNHVNYGVVNYQTSQVEVSVPNNYPIVEQPVAELSTPEGEIAPVQAETFVPDNYPVVELPEASIPSVDVPIPPSETPTPPVSTPPSETPAPPVSTPPSETPAPPVSTPPSETPAPPVNTPPSETPAPPVSTPSSETPAPPVSTPSSETPAPPVSTPPSETPAPPVSTPPSETPAPPVSTPPSETPAPPVSTPPSGTPAVREKPVVTLSQATTNHRRQLVTVNYTLTDKDRTLKEASLNLYEGDQLVQSIALDTSSSTGSVDVKLPKQYTDYRIETTMKHQANATDEVESGNTQAVRAELKDFEIKDLINVQFIALGTEKNQSASESESATPPIAVAKLSSASHKDVLLHIKGIERVQEAGMSRFKVIASHPNLVQYNAITKEYDSDIVFYVNQDGQLIDGARSEVTHLSTAKPTHALAYRNLSKLAPFYNREQLVHQANQLVTTHAFNQKEIVSIMPMIGDRFVVDAKTNATQINRAMLQYKDGSVEYVNLVHRPNTKTLLTEYELADTGLIYTPEYLTDATTEVIATVLDEFNALEYNSEEIANAFGIDLPENAKEVDEYLEKHSGMTRQEARMGVLREKLAKLTYENAFNEVKRDLREKLSLVLDNSYINFTGDRSINNLYIVDELRKNKAQILVALTYIHRLYNVPLSSFNLEDLVVARQDIYGAPFNGLEWLKGFGQLNESDYALDKNAETHKKLFANTTKQGNVMAYLSDLRRRFVPNQTDNQWFKSVLRVPILVEKQSVHQGVPKDASDIYKHLKSAKLMKLALPLLNLKGDHLYISSTMSSLQIGLINRYLDVALQEKNPQEYATKLDNVRQRVEAATERHAVHFDSLYSLMSDKVKNRLVADVLVLSGFNNHANNWLDETSEEVTIKEFFNPLYLWYPANRGLAASASKYLGVTFYQGDLLNDHNTYAHEMTHIFDDVVHLDGYARRNGQGIEAYAQGLFQPPRAGERYVGFNSVYDNTGKDTLHNTTPNRFATMADLDAYIKRMFDLMYVLDYAEAQVLLKDEDARTHSLRKIEAQQDGEVSYLDGTRNHTVDVIRRYTDNERASLQFTKWQDFIDHDALVTRWPSNGSRIGRDEYNVVDLFTPIYGAMENSQGSSGNATFKRTAYELWAAKGYMDGFIPYASNRYAEEAKQEGKTLSDSYVLNKVFNGEYKSYKDFRKAMYNERIEKLNKLKPVVIDFKGKPVTVNNYADIEDLIKQSVSEDAHALRHNVRANRTVEIKEAIYKAYFKLTNEWRSSIFN
ncbi:LysM peptidoglycan-binding domain-containing protein [Aerococcaceae bacterium NML190073]|nr:LysM peptidoglycan-binding domain-containing protein [Aerococcaceae bacterium NML190073]